MKVAMVSEHASPLAVVGGVDAGGQNVHVAALAHALARRGHDVVVYTRRDDPALDRSVGLGPGVRVVHLPAGPPRPVAKDLLLPYLPELTSALAAELHTNRPDLLHAHFWMSGVAAMAATQNVDVAVVQSFHALGVVKRRLQGAADSSPPARLAAERRLTASVDRVIASCTDEVGELLGLGARRHRIDVVPCGVDTEHFTPDGPSAARTRRLRLLALGRLVPRKGLDDAIRALAGQPGAELVIAGGGPTSRLERDAEAQRLRALATELGVAERVDLRGNVDRRELPALIRSADIVVCLPWYEPFGIVPLEAMACGVPVVGSAVGGLLDTVVDGVTGRLVPARRPDLAAQAIVELAGDPILRQRMGLAGARRMRRHYTWSAVAAATEQTYLRANSARAGIAPDPVARDGRAAVPVSAGEA